MPKRRRNRPPAITLDRFLSISNTNKTGGDKAKHRSPGQTGELSPGSEGVNKDNAVHEEPSYPGNRGSGGLSDILSLIDETLGRRPSESGVEVLGRHGQEVEEPEAVEAGEQLAEPVLEESISIDNSIIPTGRILDELLYKGLGTMDVRCNEKGECSDGLSVGSVYTDKYGFRRVRGYLITTRIPVYTDWIIEEAVIKKILPRAYRLETNRGAVALVPDDYLCTLQERWGVIIKNYGKCRNTSRIGETIKPISSHKNNENPENGPVA